MEKDSTFYPGLKEFNINGSLFRVDQRYEIIRPIGHGAYGLVCAAKDSLTNKQVAIKKIPNAFANLKDTKRTLREIKLLAHFHHDNILELIDIQRPPNRDSFTELYIITGLMETDLHQVISSQQRLTEKHVQYFLYQILRGIKYMHSCNVLHRDLVRLPLSYYKSRFLNRSDSGRLETSPLTLVQKPSNLLVNSDCSLRICDFGLARVALSLDDEQPLNEVPLMTEYVATRWYRAPEVILSWKQYTKAIDIWAIGCIFAELLNRRPLFQGSDYMHQLNKIVEVLGSPSREDLAAIHNVAARQYIEGVGFKAPADWARMFPTISNAWGFDLVGGLLQFNPHRRLTVEQALAHPYLAQLHEPADEPSGPAIFNFEFEDYNLSVDQYRELIYQETIRFQASEGHADVEGVDGMDMS